MSGGDREVRILPADFGVGYAVRFYLTRLAILGTLIGLALLIPALVVLFHRDVNTLATIGIAVGLLLGLLALRASRGVHGDLPMVAARMEEDRPQLAAPFGAPLRLSFLRLFAGGRVVVLAISLLVRLRRRK